MSLLNGREHPDCDRDTFFRTPLEAARALRTSSAQEHGPSPMACAARAEPGGDLQATLPWFGGLSNRSPRTFSPSTTSNSTVSPSPTLRRNFLGLFLLIAVWLRKGQEKGEWLGSLAPLWGPPPTSILFKILLVSWGCRVKQGEGKVQQGKSHKLGAAEQLCSYHGPQDSLPPPLTPQGFPEGKQET